MRSQMPTPRRALASFVCAVLSCACAGAPQPPAAPTPEAANVPALVAEADKLYAQRETPERAREAAAVLRRARSADYQNYEVAWKLAKFNYYLGSHVGDKEARAAAFEEGVAAGEAAVRLRPDGPEGHFWLGANLGGRAQLRGALSALSAVGDIRREMETVIRLDEGFQAGSAYLALGQIDLEMPGVLGGDRQRAVETLEKGLRFGPDNAFLRLRLAEAYLAVKRPADARKQLDALFQMKPHPDYVAEYREAEREARKLSKTVESRR
jgi:tetratricopeptide (TPR) repeat protein